MNSGAELGTNFAPPQFPLAMNALFVDITPDQSERPPCDSSFARHCPVTPAGLVAEVARAAGAGISTLVPHHGDPRSNDGGDDRKSDWTDQMGMRIHPLMEDAYDFQELPGITMEHNKPANQ